MKIFSFFFLFLIVVYACGNDKQSVKQVNKTLDTQKKQPEDTIKYNYFYNDIARYIAGMPIADTSKLAKYTHNRHWKKFCAASDQTWDLFRTKTLSKVTEWATAEIPTINEKVKTIFYPFSGPDYLYVSHFFPKANKYIMFGLEPIGFIPDIQSVFNDSLRIFGDIDTTIHDALSLSYFKTIDMAHDLVNKNIHGTLPILMLFIIRTNNNIIDVKPVEISKTGEIAYLKEFQKGNEYKNLKYNRGAEITLKDNKTGLVKKVYYFSADISDAGLAVNPNCKLFLEKLESEVVTYIKSASFLMHRPAFSTIRNTVFKKSVTFLQDDSGISYKLIDKTQWNIQLYGTYTKPLPLFKGFIEYDLISAYKNNNPKPLNFSIGYLENSNMLLAKKK